jgi:hypothetical protein
LQLSVNSPAEYSEEFRVQRLSIAIKSSGLAQILFFTRDIQKKLEI